MILATIITPYTGSGIDDDPYRGRVLDDYPLNGYTQSFYSPPNEPVIVASVVIDDADFAALEVDNDYHVLHDTPNPRPPDGAQDANEWGKLRSYLAHAGMSQAQIKAAIGERDGRTRREIAAALAEWLRWQR